MLFVLAALAAALLLLCGFWAGLLTFRSQIRMMSSHQEQLEAKNAAEQIRLREDAEKLRTEAALATKIDRLLTSTETSTQVVEALDKNIGALIAILQRAGHLKTQDAAAPMGPSGWGRAERPRDPDPLATTASDSDRTHKKSAVPELAAGT